MTVVTGGEAFPLGPGELSIGLTGTPIDVSCLINNAIISPEKDEGDSVTKLCGTVVPGSVKYTYTLAGNIDLDIAATSGLWALSQQSPGQQVDFTFTPNTDAGTTATGKLVLDPLPFGGEETTETMAADFEFAIVDKPTYTVGAGGAVLGVPADEDETTATGAAKRSRKAEPAPA
jgi:hypothetical protein